MASQDLQAKANQLNARMQQETSMVIDHLERTLIRPIARSSYACVVKCYDDAGEKSSAEQIAKCSEQCQGPYQMSHQIVQQEVGQFQERVSRAMMQCNDEASAMITPAVQKDARKMKKVEDTVLKCMSKVVDEQVMRLGPMKERIQQGLKQVTK
jgi:urease gamma subunit